MSTTSQRSNHITRVRNAVTQWIDAQNTLHELRREWDSLGLGSGLVESDFTGENSELIPSDVANVYTTVTAEENLMASGHSTNLYKVSK